MPVTPPRRLFSHLAGIVLSVAPLISGAQTVSFGGHTLRTNVSPAASAPFMAGSVLRMGTGEYARAASVLSTGTFNLSGPWTTSYQMRFSCVGVPDNPGVGRPICPGDGIAFVATAGSDTQLGVGGADLGYGGSADFGQSVAFGFSTFWHEIAFGTNGSWDAPATPALATWEGSFDVSIAYDGLGQLAWAIRRTGEVSPFFDALVAWSAPTWAADARVGFTTGSGLAAEYGDVADWTLVAPANSTVPEPSTLALLAVVLPAVIVGARRRHAARR